MPPRQQVLALPPDLHLRVARDSELESGLLRIFLDELDWLQCADVPSAKNGAVTFLLHHGTGAVTFLQHHGSTLTCTFTSTR